MLRDVIKLQLRSIVSPDYASADFDELFSVVPDTWAMVDTLEGQTRFDGVSQDVAVTHKIVIRFDASVTTETWILLCKDNQRLDIVKINPWEERQDWLELICTTRGSATKEASKV